jgi:hypothetical protein
MFPALLLQVIVVLVIVGLLLWILSQIPMDPTIAKIVRVVIIVAVCIWLLYLLVGMLGGLPAPYPIYRR